MQSGGASDGTNLHAGVQSRFSGLVNEADSLHAETGNLFASTALLRAALELCPDCKAAINPGHLSEKVFVFDEYADRKLLTDSILPALSHYRPKRILWVGVQVRYPKIPEEGIKFQPT